MTDPTTQDDLTEQLEELLETIDRETPPTTKTLHQDSMAWQAEIDHQARWAEVWW